MRTQIVATLMLGAALLLATVAFAQPAPVHNPAVAHAPCAVSGAHTRLAGLQALRAVPVRYDAGFGRERAALASATVSVHDMRRDILQQLNRACR
jgi:hypothetical protein